MASAIEWTDETWNPVTGCTRVSPGCDHCYMFAMYPRLRGMGVRGYEHSPETVQALPERLGAPLEWKKPKRVFVNSMSDLFHPAVDYGFVSEVFRVMAEAAAKRGHIFQVLTKRPGRAVGWWEQQGKALFNSQWPEQVWLGTSVENQKYAPRIEVLARAPAPTRFVSAEPLLGFVDLRPYLQRGDLQWVIAGGESGVKAREMNPAWARSLREQCREFGVSFFLKQLGGSRDKRGGAVALLDGKLWRELPAVA